MAIYIERPTGESDLKVNYGPRDTIQISATVTMGDQGATLTLDVWTARMMANVILGMTHKLTESEEITEN